MKLLFLATLTLGILIIPTQTHAQTQWIGYPYHHASTATEGYLNGTANLWIGRGYYLKAKGQYLNEYEYARKENIDNWAHWVRTRQAIKDEWRERNRTENALDRKERMLDQTERMYAIKQREQNLIKKGILPKKEESCFIHDGKKFYSIEEWRDSPEYKAQMIENQMRELRRQIKKQAEEQMQEETISFLRMWRGMSYLARERYLRMNSSDKARYQYEWKHPSLKWKRLEEEQNRRFYQARPYLRPSAGGNGLPPSK